MPTPPESLSERFIAGVERERQQRGLSINRLADFAGLGRGYVSELLRGQKVPTLTTVEKIAAALEIEPCVLLCGAPQGRVGVERA